MYQFSVCSCISVIVVILERLNDDEDLLIPKDTHLHGKFH